MGANVADGRHPLLGIQNVGATHGRQPTAVIRDAEEQTIRHLIGGEPVVIKSAARRDQRLDCRYIRRPEMEQPMPNRAQRHVRAQRHAHHGPTVGASIVRLHGGTALSRRAGRQGHTPTTRGRREEFPGCEGSQAAAQSRFTSARPEGCRRPTVRSSDTPPCHCRRIPSGPMNPCADRVHHDRRPWPQRS